jgi:hypothetical protein
MLYLLRRFDGHVHHAGVAYQPEAWGGPLDDHRWQGGVRFVAVETGLVLTTGRETVQSSLAGVAYWASGLRPAYLDGAIIRAADRRPPRARAMIPPPAATRPLRPPPVAETLDVNSARVACAPRPAQDAMVQVRGLVESIVVSSVTVLTEDGTVIPVDLLTVGAGIRRGIRPGDGVCIAARRDGRRLIAARVRRTV